MTFNDGLLEIFGIKIKTPRKGRVPVISVVKRHRTTIVIFCNQKAERRKSRESVEMK